MTDSKKQNNKTPAPRKPIQGNAPVLPRKPSPPSTKAVQPKRSAKQVQQQKRNAASREAARKAAVQNSQGVTASGNIIRVVEKKEKKHFFKKQRRMDSIFLILVLILVACGLVMVFSASYASALFYKGDSYRFISKQVISVGLGIAAMLVVSRIDYHIFIKGKMPYIIYGIALMLLVVVLFMKPLNDAKRWIIIGGQTFQPSEIMKFAIIVLYSFLICKYHREMHTFRYGVMTFLLYLVPVIGLLMLEPHLSGTILTVGIALVMMYVGGTRMRYFWAIIPLGAVGVVGIIAIKGVTYVSERINGWLNPLSDISDDTWQTVQSLIAIGSGGLMGEGFGNSKQKYMYLPEPQNDFIFAIVCEELGLIGAVMLILVYILLIFRGLSIAIKSPDRFGFMMGVGLMAQIGLQTIANIAVVTNTIPNTGISLPFFSFGGTAIAIQLVQMGVLLNISRQTVAEKT